MKPANSMANNEYRVIVSAEANDMLVEHIGFLAQVSPKAALILSSDLFIRLKNLEKTPYLYPVFFSEKVKSEYRKLNDHP